MSEREEAGIRERDYYCREIIFMFLGFTFGVDYISKEVAGFPPYGFPKETSLCLLSLVFIVVHVIISDKILRSYCLNDKNLTWNQC